MQKGSFARNWQFIKLARTWHPHEIAGEILGELLKSGSRETREQLGNILFSIGSREGARFLERIPEGMDTASTIESFCLVNGVPCEVERKPVSATLYVKKECGTLLPEETCSSDAASAFLRGFIRAIANDAFVRDSGNFLVVEIVAA